MTYWHLLGHACTPIYNPLVCLSETMDLAGLAGTEQVIHVLPLVQSMPPADSGIRGGWAQNWRCIAKQVAQHEHVNR